MKKVIFLIPSLSGGGAERVLVHILKHMDRDKFKPVLAVFEKKGEYLEDLPSDLNIEVLGNRISSRYGFQWLVVFKFIKILKAENPDAVVSFMWYQNLIALTARIISRVKCSVAVSERCALSVSHEGWFTDILRHLTVKFMYPRAEKVIVNSRDMGNELIQMYKSPKDKVALIYNPVDIQKAGEMSHERIEHPWFNENIPLLIGVGRLETQKGFEYLIKALKIVISEGIKCRLIILGKGTEENTLKQLTKRLHVENETTIAGFRKNPYKYMACSTIFILPSIYEGFPNALLEAMALGVPSIAANCPTGPDEIITDGLNGVLVPPADEYALADAIKRLLQDDELRKHLSEAGRKRIEDFSARKIVKEYEDLIENLCGKLSEH